MELFMLSLLLGAVSLCSGAAFQPFKQAQVTTAVPTDCGAPVTVTTVVTVSYPTFITVANPDWSSIESSLSYVASVDTVQVSDASELVPLSETPAGTTPTFVHSILAPGYTASQVDNGNSSVYFVSVGPDTTLWNYTPTSPVPVTIGLTTVTVLPIPVTPTASPVATVNTTVYTINSTSYIHRTTLVTVTAPGNTVSTSYASSWNLTQATNATSLVGTGAGGPGIVTVTEIVPASTETVNMTVYPTYSSSENFTGFGYPKTTNSSVSAAITGATFGRRQVSSPAGVCTLIFATIGGHLASWCNNWDGSTPVTLPTYTTTITPFPPTATTTSEPSTVTISLTASTNTVTNSVTIASSTLPPPSTAPGPSSPLVTGTTTPGSATASAPPAASSCGQEGNFEISFDDLPVYSPSNNDTAPIPPIFNPYQHFFWGNGWGYCPPPTEPFPPQSGDHLAEYVPGQENNDTGSPDAGSVPDSSFGCGPRAYNDNYWFDAQSAFVGCDNGATDPSIMCDFVATGYQWDSATQKEQVVVTEHFPQPPCPNFKNCELQQIFFGSEFTMLTSLSFYANVQGQLKIYWVDTIELSWWNNTCAAGLNRLRQE